MSAIDDDILAQLNAPHDDILAELNGGSHPVASEKHERSLGTLSYEDPGQPKPGDRSLGTLSYENQGLQPNKAQRMRAEIDKANKAHSDPVGQARSWIQGLTGGNADELVSRGETAVPALSSWDNLRKAFTGEKVVGKSYEENQAENRPVYKEAVKNHPVENFAGAMEMPIPGSSKVKGGLKALQTITQGAAVGGINAFGNSEAQDSSGLTKDTLKGAGVGMAVSAIPALAGWARGGIQNAATKGLTKAEADSATQAEKAVVDAIDSARGKYRSGVQSASRDLEVLEREAEKGVGAAKQKAQDFLATPEAQKLRERVLNGKLQTAPERIAEMDNLEKTLNDLLGSKEQDIAAKNKEILDKGIIGNVAKKAVTYGKRAIPFAAQAGTMALAEKMGLGHVASGFLGSGAGLTAAMTMGNMPKAIQNTLNAPGFRASLYDNLGRLVADGKLGEFGPIISEAAGKGQNALAATHYILQKNYPEYAKLTGGIDKPTQGPADFTAKFNTQLSPADEQKFQDWAKQHGKLKDLTDYDLRGAWKSGIATAPNGHLPDTYKKPNHPTFSTDSQYNGADGQEGGKWSQDSEGNDVFEPSAHNLKNMTQNELQKYFKQKEPNARLKLKR